MKLLKNCLLYIQRFLKIVDKKGNVIPFELNEAQLELYGYIRDAWKAGKPVRIIVLKARQLGISTLIEAIGFWLTATAAFVRGLIVAHTDEATNNLFQMSKRYYDNLPEALKPQLQASNAKELVFDKPLKAKGSKGLGSWLKCITAGGKGIGRGFTVKFLHLSEFAFWPGNKRKTLLGLMQAVPDEPGTIVVIESTPNGFDEFKELWDQAVADHAAGRDGFLPVFFPWFKIRSYRRSVPKDFKRTEEEQALADTFNLDDQQLAWRRWCIAINCGGDVDLFKQEYPSTPDEAFLATGRCVFDKKALVLRRQQVQGLLWEYGSFLPEFNVDGTVRDFKWRQESGGPVRILKHPEQGVPYVLGCDTAGTGTDFFAGHVLDNRTGEQVAVIHHQFGERTFAEQAYCLAMYYNEALLGVEINYSTYPQICLQELGYKRFYIRQRLDTYTGKLTDAYGFETNRKSRPLIVDGLKDVVQECLEGINDYATLGEMLSFIYDENWRSQAEVGSHDDLVMSLAIAHFIRAQQRTSVEVPKVKGTAQWTADMYEDYQQASPEQRAAMIKDWGEPV